MNHLTDKNIISLVKCLDLCCDYTGPIKSYLQDAHPKPGHTGYWCPKCGYSVELTKDGNNIDYFIDDDTLELGLKLLGKIEISTKLMN